MHPNAKSASLAPGLTAFALLGRSKLTPKGFPYSFKYKPPKPDTTREIGLSPKKGLFLTIKI
jgi:hypothetical protein